MAVITGTRLHIHPFDRIITTDFYELAKNIENKRFIYTKTADTRRIDGQECFIQKLQPILINLDECKELWPVKIAESLEDTDYYQRAIKRLDKVADIIKNSDFYKHLGKNLTYNYKIDFYQNETLDFKLFKASKLSNGQIIVRDIDKTITSRVGLEQALVGTYYLK
ncbi:hypothetical protein [Lactobacillus jensenii]|uniref:Uncharacterized protein n=2 Tax=Lactobacillales TaxID=186826 RepID=A0ABU9FH99_LACJE|nr:hypothetical protein [Lactobacillus jensenii]DAR66721.1 MAG TPA: hypothetical protein [Caudoviricetes sp.]MCW8072174.1 hypothetical protein [Lactobacillus jensenii]MCW8089598.1 hypothetical protein [Lactobacillus jensenii]MDK8236080.1 hypothetical protein [Lactobacillus jensenii]MDT9544368.1 hypothetical protein [Lactobacillus jensenii]